MAVHFSKRVLIRRWYLIQQNNLSLFLPPMDFSKDRLRKAARTLRRYADSCDLATQSCANDFGVEVFFADTPLLPQAKKQEFEGN